MHKIWFIVVGLIFLLGWQFTPTAPKLYKLDISSFDLSALQKLQDEPQVIPGAEKKILWQSGKFEKTPRALLYLHGFSASRQEISPVAETLAQNLNANLYLPRLSAHGFAPNNRDYFKRVHSEDWLTDAVEALSITHGLGNKITILGTSTGAILALFLAHEYPELLERIILLSPNFAPANASANIFLLPGGETLARTIMGNEREWKASNPEQEKFWSTRYDLNALSQMMRLLKILDRKFLSEIKVPLHVVYTPNDQVVSINAIKENFEFIGSDKKELIKFENAKDHVLAGNIISPDTNAELLQLLNGFFR